ncbi:MAG: hypothetical protein Q7T25_14135 [Sideroxyarcus sp.]|nr:hypothetical protein [Sideroxyarcus sp.]
MSSYPHAIEVYAAAATEPVTVAEVMAHCHLDASNQEPAPGVITAALAGTPIAGNVTAGAHRYLATFVTADGETQAGTVSAAVTVADAAVNGKVSLTAIPLGGSLVTSRKLYRTAAGGTAYLLLATIADNTTTTYTDNIADASLGAGAPTTNTTSDPLLNVLIASARATAEQYLHRYLVAQTLDAYFDAFPMKAPYEFVLPPLATVTSITYVDEDGASQTLAASGYSVDAKSKPARISLAYDESWPDTRVQNNAVTIRFVAGYGAAAAVPQCVKQWMMLRIKTAWENREALVVGTSGMVELPSAFVDGLLDSERVVGRL